MDTRELLDHLKALEVALHEPAVRGNAVRLRSLLHEEFYEIGRSGRTYTRAAIPERLSSEASATRVWSGEFALVKLADSAALLTYRSAHMGENGQITRETFRSSVWQKVEGDWKMRFHQGTPTNENAT